MKAVRILMLAPVLALMGCSNLGKLVLENSSSSKTATIEIGAHDLSKTAVFDLQSFEDTGGATFETNSADVSVDANGIVTLNSIPSANQSFKIYVKGSPTGNWIVTLEVKHNAIDSYAIKSWGYNDLGMLLDGNTGNAITTPTTPSMTTLKFKQISPGHDHVCAVAEDGQGYCWGNGANGRLGTGASTNGSSPLAVDTTKRFKSIITAGPSWVGSRGHTCGIAINGKVFCWGTNTYGQLGDNSNTDRLSPVAVQSSEVFSSLALSTESTCGLTMRGKIYCWGRGLGGELGQGNTLNSSVPVAVSGSYSSLATGIGGFCALQKNDKTIFCWGIADRGNVRYIANTFSSTEDDAMPQLLRPTLFFDRTKYKTISGGASSFCGILESGRINCWGHEMYGRLGIGQFEGNPVTFYAQIYVPYPIDTATTFKSVSVGITQSCAITDDDELWCWGRNENGILGLGNLSTTGAFGHYSPIPLNDGHQYSSVHNGSDFIFGLVR